MNKKTSLLRFNLKTLLHEPVIYFMAILFELFVSTNFYIRKGFFTGKGNTDLLLFFSYVPYILIIIIPAITYKFNSYIYDAFIPLKTSEILFSHIAASFIIYLFFILLLLPAALCVNFFGSLAPSQLFCSLLLLLFYGFTLITLCVFINELISMPLVSFITEVVILAVFNSAHLFVVYFSFSNFISSFLKEISFAWHFNSASKGIIDSRDILYFIILSLTFFEAALISNEVKKGRIFTKSKKITHIFTFILLFLLLINSGIYHFRIDTSKNKKYSLTSASRTLSKEIIQPLKITYYRSSSLSSLYPQIKEVEDYMIDFSNLNKNISFQIKNPDKDSSLAKLLENYGITSQQMQTVKNNGTEYLNVYSALVFEYLGKFTVIPFIMNCDSLEYDLNVKLSALLFDKIRLVNIVIGNGMSLDQDYAYLVPWLNSQGFICNVINVDDSDFTNRLLKSSGPLLVIGDSNISIDNAIAIENYILSNRGNAFLCISPYSVNISQDWAVTANFNTNLVEMAENWGIWFENKIAADISSSQITMYSQEESDPLNPSSTYTRVLNYPLWVNLLPQQYCKKGATLFWASPITVTVDSEEGESSGKTEILPKLVTSPQSYFYECDKDSPKNLIMTNPFELENADISQKERLSQILGVEISGPLQGLYNYASTDKARVFVLSDQYFVNSLMTGYIGGDYGDYRNYDFLTSELLLLNNEEELAKIHSKNLRDNSLYKISDMSSFVKYQLITYAFIFLVIPLLIILTGVLVWIRKKSRLMHI